MGNSGGTNLTPDQTYALGRSALLLAPCRRFQFVRGDINFDLELDPQDALLAVVILFDPAFSLDRDCPAVLDANNDGGLNILDALTIIQTAFATGSLPFDVQPAPPFPGPGVANENSLLPCDEGVGASCPDQ